MYKSNRIHSFNPSMLYITIAALGDDTVRISGGIEGYYAPQPEDRNAPIVLSSSDVVNMFDHEDRKHELQDMLVAAACNTCKSDGTLIQVENHAYVYVMGTLDTWQAVTS